jgi:hypothetical protein
MLTQTGDPLMRTLIEIFAALAILTNAVVYGTDVFGAIVLRPAIAAVDDRTLTQLRKPVNTALTAAALAGRVPRDARQLQSRWDSVINARVALQMLALAALCVGLAAASPRGESVRRCRRGRG